jgi:serine-type D-Ala-D-Ala carboxypeptidase/endopeptidase (penicillin-binding protein 4)
MKDRSFFLTFLLGSIVILASCTPIKETNASRTVFSNPNSIGITQPRTEPASGEKLLSTLPPDKGVWGVAVQSLSRGQPLFDWNQDFLFVPASNMKLFTTAVALVRLGPDYRYTTSLYADAPVEKGILEGNLFVRGSGDPTLSGRFHEKCTNVFEDWAAQLKTQGIKEIRGNVIGDDRIFDDAITGEGWSFDDDLFCYSARISALSFNDNCLDVILSPGAHPGDPAQMEVSPNTTYAQIQNGVITAETGLATDLHGRRISRSPVIDLKGHIGIDKSPQRFRVAVSDPTLYAVTVFKEVLVKKGIMVRGVATGISEVEKRPNYDALTMLSTYQSPPLSVIIESTNKLSQNLYAELLFRTLGAIYGHEGSTSSSASVMKQSLEEMGISANSMSIHDGSGLSRLNLVSPRHLVQLLDYMSRHPYFDHFLESFPVAGKDGTLAARLRSTGSKNSVRAKTGTLSHVGALSGYARNSSGDFLAFSILNNNSTGSGAEVRDLLDTLCRKILRLDLENR